VATAYPAAIDALNNPTAGDNLDSASVLHTTQHTNVNDAVEAIETELGTNPRGTALSVKARLDAVDAAIASKLNSNTFHAAFGVATLDGAQKLVENVDASKVSSGTLAAARLPNHSGALILGTGSGGAAIPVDAVPNLPASKTTSGQFNVAQIPPLPGSQITSGTIPRTRLPADIAANSLVKADIAGRDAIVAADRIDGLMVFVRNPKSLWMWRADNSTWECLSLRVVLTAAQSTAAAGAFSNVSNFQFPTMAGVTYGIDVVVFMTSSSSTPDMKFGWVWSGSGTMHSGFQGQDTTATSSFTGSFASQALLADAGSPLDHANGVGVIIGAPTVARLYGTFVCSGSGSIQMRFAQVTSDATLPAIAVGSRMRVESY
jgi:hypothetical protein